MKYKAILHSTFRGINIVNSIAGFCITSLILNVLRRRIKINTHPDTILTAITTCMDFLACTGLLFRGIFTKVPYNVLTHHPNWCKYDAVANAGFLVNSGYCLSMVALERMLLVVFNINIPIWIWLLPICFFCGAFQFGALYTVLKGNEAISPIRLYCIFKLIPDTKPYYIMITVIAYLTYIITIVSYIGIIVFSYRQCIKQLELNVPRSQVNQQCRSIVLKSLAVLIPYMVMYSGKIYCWTYEFITGRRRTFMMEYVGTLLMSMTVVINCVTVLFMNREVRKDFFKMLGEIREKIIRR